MSVEQDQNPFAAPLVRDTPAISPLYERPLKPHWAWFCMFVVNLPIPLIFGFDVTDESRWIGMLFGIAAVYLCGFWGCNVMPRIMYRLNIGSSLVAVSQFFPILHIIVGSMAVDVSKPLFGEAQRTSGDMTGIAEITSATILTGIGLIIPSLAMGTVIVAVFRLDRNSDRI